MISALNILIRMLVGVIVLIVAGGTIWIAGASWAESSRFKDYADCSMRRMEANISNDLGNIHLDYCMASKGYDRSGCDIELPLMPSCYIPRWRNW